MKRVLLIAFQFPPARSNEVRRVQKIAKYLLSNNYEVEVICSANPGLPLDDYARWKDIESDNLIVHRINHYNNQPKPKVHKLFTALFRLDWRINYTLKVGKFLWLNKEKLNEYEYIYCTIRPYSMLLLPSIIKRISTAKVLIDFRFLFYLESYYYLKLGKFNILYKAIDRYLLRSALRNSDYRVTLTESLGAILKKETGFSFFNVEQGYDREDLEISLKKEDYFDFYIEGKINVVYTGSVAPSQADPSEMAQVILIMIKKNPDVVFHFFGLIGGLEKRLQKSDQVKFYNYLNIKQFTFVGKTADVLWMYYSNNKLNDFRVGTKTYDYMNFGKPILCFCSDKQETVRVLKHYKSKLIITNNYNENAAKINFSKLKLMEYEESHFYDISQLYYPFLEPKKYINEI